MSLQNLARETCTSPRTAPGSSATPSSTGRGGFGSKKGVRIENDLAGQGATSRITGAYFADGDQHLDYDTLQEHQAPNTTSDFAFKGALRDQATAVWRGMIRVEPEAPTNAYQENRNLLLSPKAHADSIPGPRDPGQRRPLHARRDRQPGRPGAALLRHGARPHAVRRGAPDPARLLPGRARPNRARAGAGSLGRGARSPHPAGLGGTGAPVAGVEVHLVLR